jgi:predicted ATP-dependent endonuclease of OLD family
MNAQVVIVTHSPYLFPLECEEQVQVVRFDRDSDSVTHTASVEESLITKIAPKLRQSGNEKIAFSSAVILTEGKYDQVAIRTLAEYRRIDLDGANVALIDCGSRDNIPDYVRFCDGLGLRFLAIQDGDASNKVAAKNVLAVRDAVLSSKHGAIFEFPENLEFTLRGVEKNASSIAEAVRSLLVLTEPLPEIEALYQAIVNLVLARGQG